MVIEIAALGQKIDAAVSLAPGELAELYDTLARVIEAGVEAQAQSGDPFTQDRRPVELSTWLMARELIHHRRQRRRFFSTMVFGEPAWEMLLALFAHTPGEEGMTAEKLISSVEVPASVGKRWIDYLERERLLVRHAAGADEATSVISLTPEAEARLTSYIESIEAQPSWHAEFESKRAKLKE